MKNKSIDKKITNRLKAIMIMKHLNKLNQENKILQAIAKQL